MFCRNCGKKLVLNSGNICPQCGGFTRFCRSCGKGLVLNPDNTCANCGADGVKATSFCRYCGKPTGRQDLNCPACGSAIIPIPVEHRVKNKKTQRLVMLGNIVAALITLGIGCFLIAKVNESALSGLFSKPVPKQGSSKNVTIDLIIENGTFSMDKIYAETGSMLIVNFTNKDIGIEHNFVIYREVEGQAAQIIGQKPVMGPGTAVYKLKVPAFRASEEVYWFTSGNPYPVAGFLIPTWPTP